MTLIIFICLVKPVFSQEDYSIENLRISINIDDKGSAHVIENITYRFYSQSYGITGSLYIDNNSKLDNLKAYEIYPDKKQLQLDLFNYDSNLDFRVYDKSNIETKIYKIEYDLEDFIIKHNSVDEFKFKIFDINNNEPIKKLNISIYFPNNKTYGSIKAFQHGYIYKNIIVEKNKVSYSMKNFPKNIELELKILLSQDIPICNIQNDNNYTQLLNKEFNIEKKYKNKINKIKKINMVSITVFIVEGLYLMISFLNRSIFQKVSLPRNYNSKLPNDYTPAIMISLFKYKKITSKAFFITILDLIRKGYISETNDGINTKWELVLTNKDFENLKEHEKYLLNRLFSFIENNNVICLKDIKKYNQNEKNFLEFKRFYNTWKRKVYKECGKYGYLKTNNQMKFLLYLYSYLKISAGILFIYQYSPYLHVVSRGLIVSGLVNNIVLIKCKLTRLGYKERKKCINFKKFIINFKNPKILNSDNLKIWEKYIVYSIAMGIQKDLLYKLRNNNDIKNNVYFNKSIDKKFIKSLNIAFRTNELDSFLIFKKT
ncbi:DUF2207 domain-containing protein [Tepidibacter hydrothermalis]|uniref:DUF2207 domain-containing protein n=1 Tax=Tepidibacter hydrothermalis TaxID=3036126 RepID=A0ABY8EGL2_9FIRM|nr:DUF2207 domain-containing protein [Tepidibacter hydrothermalis]WFD12083.1 DUF2207 domain-containing protein [Tepidibacter hydrothermalis]